MKAIYVSDSAELRESYYMILNLWAACLWLAFKIPSHIYTEMPLSGDVTQFIRASGDFFSHLISQTSQMVIQTFNVGSAMMNVGVNQAVYVGSEMIKVGDQAVTLLQKASGNFLETTKAGAAAPAHVLSEFRKAING